MREKSQIKAYNAKYREYKRAWMWNKRHPMKKIKYMNPIEVIMQKPDVYYPPPVIEIIPLDPRAKKMCVSCGRSIDPVGYPQYGNYCKGGGCWKRS